MSLGMLLNDIDFSDPKTIIVLAVIGVLIVAIIVAAIIFIKLLNKNKDDAVPAPDYIPSPIPQEGKGNKRFSKGQNTIMPDAAPQNYMPQGRPDYRAPEPMNYRQPAPADFAQPAPPEYNRPAPADYAQPAPMNDYAPAPGDPEQPGTRIYHKSAPADFAQPAPAEYNAPAPADFAQPAPAEYNAPAPADFAQPAPVEYNAPAPADFAQPAPAEYNAPAPADFAQPAPAEYNAPAPADFAQPAPAEYNAPAPAVSAPYMEDDDSNTVLLGADAFVGGYTMVRKKTGEQFTIDKDEFYIGKERAKVDFCVTNNNSVSRRHARITVRDGKCFICDLGSTNSSYINGTKLSPHQEIALIPGDVIRLSNEDFDYLG